MRTGCFRHWYKSYNPYGSGWEEIYLDFSILPPDAFIKMMDEERSKYSERHPDAEKIFYKPYITHEIYEEDFENKNKFSIPIHQYVYG